MDSWGTGTVGSVNTSTSAVAGAFGGFLSAVGTAAKTAMNQIPLAMWGIKGSLIVATSNVGATVVDILNMGRKNVGTAASNLMASIPNAALRGQKDAVLIATGIPAAIASGIQSRRDTVTSAMDALATAMKNSMTPAAERAKLVGELTGKQLAAGLHSKDPVVFAAATSAQVVILKRLAELGPAATTLGKGTVGGLVTGLLSAAGLKKAKAAGQTLWDAINAPFSTSITVRLTGKYSGKLVPLAAGAWNLAQDTMAMVHAGEMVVPAQMARNLRAALSDVRTMNGSPVFSTPASSWGKMATNSGGGGDTVIHTHVMLDGRQVAEVVDRYQGIRYKLSGSTQFSPN